MKQLSKSKLISIVQAYYIGGLSALTEWEMETAAAQLRNIAANLDSLLFASKNKRDR